MAGELQGRVALVAGGATGTGRAVAEALAARGARVFLGDPDVETALAAALEASATGGQLSALRLDPADPHAWSSAAAVAGEHGPLGLLVYAAGSAPAASLGETDPAQWTQALERGCTGFFLACRALLPVLPPGGHGQLIAIAPPLTSEPSPHHLAAWVARAGLVALVRCLAREPLAGTQVWALLPGPETAPGDV
ncbi:MAG: SDR family oxidoreductase, partial [Armatimonadetes bacterium]|nr:SDR family oxidoreductase [Armatimonadota bacterium]